MEFIKNNPALFNSFVIGLVAAIIAVVVALGVPVSVELIAAIEGLIAFIAAIIIGVVTRGAVVPFKNVLEYRSLNPNGTTSVDVTAGPANDHIIEGQTVRPYTFEAASDARH